MESASFSHSAQRLLRDQASAWGAQGTVAHSLPVAVRAGLQGAIADAVFLYGETPGRGRPLAWALLDPAGGTLVAFSRCEYNDFAVTASYPLDMNLSLQTPRFMTSSQTAEARRELLGLYERLRPFALADSLSREQEEIRRRYAELLEALAYIRHRAFYEALAPEFVEWLGLGWECEGLPDGPPKRLEAREKDSVAETLLELRELFEQKLKTDSHKQKLFDEMHAELQQHKNNLLDALTRPIEGDVIKLIEDIEKSMEIYRSRHFTPDNFRRLLTLFEGVGTDLSDLLYRHGIEPFSVEGENVDVSRQKILAVVPAEKKRQDKKVAVRHSRGWEKNGKVIRPERISVYVYEPPGEVDNEQ